MPPGPASPPYVRSCTCSFVTIQAAKAPLILLALPDVASSGFMILPRQVKRLHSPTAPSGTCVRVPRVLSCHAPQFVPSA